MSVVQVTWIRVDWWRCPPPPARFLSPGTWAAPDWSQRYPPASTLLLCQRFQSWKHWRLLRDSTTTASQLQTKRMSTQEEDQLVESWGQGRSLGFLTSDPRSVQLVMFTSVMLTEVTRVITQPSQESPRHQEYQQHHHLNNRDYHQWSPHQHHGYPALAQEAGFQHCQDHLQSSSQQCAPPPSLWMILTGTETLESLELGHRSDTGGHQVRMRSVTSHCPPAPAATVHTSGEHHLMASPPVQPSPGETREEAVPARFPSLEHTWEVLKKIFWLMLHQIDWDRWVRVKS